MLGSNAKEQIQLVYLLVFSTRNESNHPKILLGTSRHGWTKLQNHFSRLLFAKNRHNHYCCYQPSSQPVDPAVDAEGDDDAVLIIDNCRAGALYMTQSITPV